MARRRRRTGNLGKTNRAMRCLIPGFMLKRSNMFLLFPMLASWAWLELTEGWHSWFESEADVTASHRPVSPAPASVETMTPAMAE